MSEPETTPAENQEENGGDRLYTLSEVSQRTGISMPTLQRYKKLYQGRIPSVGKGRKQRYPEHALPVFDELKNENAGKRGRPRKDAAASTPRTRTAAKRASGGARGGRGAAAAAGGRKATASKRGAAAGGGRKAAAKAPAKTAAKTAAKKASPARGGRPRKNAAAAGARGARGGARGAQRSDSNLLTLTEVSKQTGISYPTLVRYVRVHSNKLPSEGTGRSRRFHPEAVDVFRELRQESGRGGRKPAASKRGGATRGRAAASSARSTGTDSALQQRLKQLEKGQEALEKRLRGFVQSLQKLFR